MYQQKPLYWIEDMNALSTKVNTGPLPNSFAMGANAALNTGANAIKNVAANTTNAIKNVATTAMNDIGEHINESIGAVPSTAPSVYLSVPIIICVGMILVTVILCIVFKQQLLDAIDRFFGIAIVPPPTEPSPPATDQDGQTLDIINKLVPTRKQVFNVSENRYTFSDAEPLCKALGAELATYDQVKQAWDQGADWCNYGWIKGQGAVYPTQQSTFDSLQTGTSDDERLACGTVGVNGGFMDDPALRFGVNCYGDKPVESEHDLKNMLQNRIPPLTPDVLEQTKKELKYKSEQGQIGILPYRKGAWSS